MALEKVFKIPSLVRKAGQSASKAQPFYSNVDQAIANITQGTGTGAQMLAELLKTKGVAKELKDRPVIKKTLEANKDAKVTKADLERLAAENPPPQIDETALGGKQNYSDAEIEREYRRIYGSPYTSDGERIGIEEMRDAVISSTAGVDSSFAPKYAKHTIPGGENYREILLRLPVEKASAKDQQRLLEIQERIRELSPIILRQPVGVTAERKEFHDLTHEKLRINRLIKGEKGYHSHHFEEPNVLAHARVADRVGPNGEKILHVEEIQSDWHQAGRKKGYKGENAKKAEDEFKSYSRDLASKYGLNPQQNLAMYATMNRMQPDEVAKYEELQSAWANSKGGVPDAPFKKNWHELVMKRLLDDAARNGYDKVVITPGAEQAKRYDLSKQVDKIVWNEKTGTLAAQRAGGDTGTIKYDNVPSDKLADYIGKEAAEKLINAPDYSGWRSIEGGDLKVGGEGMKGFYDQILPSYLNDLGKRYGVQVGTYEMPVGEKIIPDRAGLGMIRSGEQEMVPFHSFDITPQMREEITTKGVPLYQAAPPVAIGAGAMQEEQPSEYAGGGIIKKAGQIIGKAAQSSGMARPVTATKDLTTLQDFHTSLGDRIREAVAEKQRLMESMPFKYDKGQRVFTEDSARKNRLPYEILDRTLYGNMPMRADHPVLGPGKGAVIRDPETGKAMRTPYEAGYRVRSEDPEGWHEYVLPETAIKGDVEMAGGGAVRKALKAVLPKGQQAVLPAAESAANLERFLADSAIKDRLYHATPKSFSEFIPGGDNPLRSGPAVWMTPNKFEQPAAHNIRVIPDKPGYMYGNQSGKFTPGTNVMPLHSSIKNPLYSSEATWKQDFEKFGGSPWTLEPSNIQSMKSAGFDGIVYRDRHGDIAEVVAFEPTQVKSAIGNRGTYDPAEADITKAKGGRVTNDAMWMAVQNKQLRKKHGN